MRQKVTKSARQKYTDNVFLVLIIIGIFSSRNGFPRPRPLATGPTRNAENMESLPGMPPARKGVSVNFLPIDLLPSRPGARFKATRFMISIANLRR